MLDSTNPLAHASSLPYQLPDFAAIEIHHLKPAILEGMRIQVEEWQSISHSSESPTVENTVVAVDDSGELFDRAVRVFYTLASSLGGDELNALQEELAPLLSAHTDAFMLDRDMYDRYKTLSESTDLDDETRWLISDTAAAFERAGVNLAEADKKRLRKLNSRIASTEVKISLRISHQLSHLGLTGTDISELDGLPAVLVEEAKAAGQKRGAAWFLPLENYTSQEALASLKDPETRQRLLDIALSRGVGADPATRTSDLIPSLVKDRAERAALLGFPNHAEYVMAGQTVPNQKTAVELLTTIGLAAKAGVNRLETQMVAKTGADAIGPANWPYFEAQERKNSLDFNPDSLRDYLPLNQVINDGVFFAANRLYGISFTPRADLRGWHDDVAVWEVHDRERRAIGLFVADFYTRPGKDGGAWMTTLVPACGRSGTRPVVTNDANFARPSDGSEVLLSWDNVETCFHEFGHALHGLLTNTYYRETEGTEVPSDFVELPSQLNEMWAYHHEVLSRMARHKDTGQPLPAQVLTRLAASKTKFQEYATLEFVESALIDQAWHSLHATQSVSDIEVFEEEALQDSGVAHPSVPPRYRSGYFAHAFTGGYDAAYYSYLWSETMVAELEEWLRDQPHGGLSPVAGDILRNELLCRGNSRPPMESFRAILGHDPEPDAIIRRRGL